MPSAEQLTGPAEPDDSDDLVEPDESQFDEQDESDDVLVEIAADDPAGLDASVIAEVMERGELAVIGRLTSASNWSLVVHSELDGVTLACVYKPIRGERPLWDFPDGTLAEREYASAIVAKAAGWDCTPPTILRGGPLGSGMVQLWIDGTDSDTAVDLFHPRDLPQGWLPVVQFSNPGDEPYVLAHADDPKLARLAAFDLVVNNADRKGEHVLPVSAGPWLGVDHGLTMHSEDKVRTVLWGWAGEKFDDEIVAGIDRLHHGLTAADGTLLTELSALLTQTEVAALGSRVDTLRATSTFSAPPVGRTAIPWPPI